MAITPTGRTLPDRETPNSRGLPLASEEARHLRESLVSVFNAPTDIRSIFKNFIAHPDDVGKRRTGRTAEQMVAAPVGAVFVWCSETTYYPSQLARFHLRHDLRVVPKSWLRLSVMGSHAGRVVVDHALSPDYENREALHYLSARFLLAPTKD